jgi:RNA-directed DNA polymerase
MDWEQYRRRFEELARRNNIDPERTAAYLTYAEHLAIKNLPIIYDFSHLSLLVGFLPFRLREVFRDPGSYYRTYDIPKRSTGFRRIAQPTGSLRKIQEWILLEILERCQPHDAAMAFVRKRSIKLNAQPHLAQRHVLSLDIKDFFASIKPNKIIRIFEDLGYAADVAKALTHLTTLDGGLPQGAPTSPALSNLIMIDVDRALSAYAIKHGLNYTRYADDLTFSGKFRPAPLIDLCRRVLRRHQFGLNDTKTRLMSSHERQEVTGVVVNKRIQAPRSVRRKLRQESYFIRKFGTPGHLEWCSSVLSNREDHLRGVAEYVLFLNPEDRDARNIVSLLGRVRYGKQSLEGSEP